jgi:hypothetical protein
VEFGDLVVELLFIKMKGGLNAMAQNLSSVVPGFPVDATMLTNMNQQIQRLNEQLFVKSYSMSDMWGTSRKKVPTPELSIWTGKILIVQNSKPTDKIERVLFGATFTIPFKTIPIVTATPYCDTTGGGTTSASTIWIHSISTTGFRARWKWLEKPSQAETVYALVTAVGQGQIV